MYFCVHKMLVSNICHKNSEEINLKNCYDFSLAGVCCRPCNPSKWEDDLRSKGLLYFTTQWTSVRTQLANSMVTLDEPGGWLGVKRWQLCLQDTSRNAKCHRQTAVGHWVSLCVCSVVEWLLVYQLGILSLSCSQYSQTISWRGWDDNACLGVRNTSIIGAWTNSLDRRLPWYCMVSLLLQTDKQTWLLLQEGFQPIVIQVGWSFRVVRFCAE